MKWTHWIPAAAAAVLILATFAGVSAAEPAFSNLDQVLDVFEDSRLTRQLKSQGSPLDQIRFVEILDNTVYKPVDAAVISHLEAIPEYEGKRIMTHDFRTPGSDPYAVNTDRDVRVIVEVEADRWIEVPADRWQDVYYREFARHTQFAGNADTAAQEDLQHHADRYRQLPTDRLHREASLDYTDQGRPVTYSVDEQGHVLRQVGAESTVEVDQSGKIRSVSQIARVKRGEGLLLDPEGLALMYQEKAADQYRRADLLRQTLEQMPSGDSRRRQLESQLQMYETESLMQSRKAVTSLAELRLAYQRMGHDVGRIPESLQSVFAEIQRLDGASPGDLERVRSSMDRARIDNLAQLNRAVSGQLESLKFAPHRSTATVPDVSQRPVSAWQRANTASNWGTTALSLHHAFKRAEEGSHILWNFDRDDTVLERSLKTAGVAALDLIPEALAAMKLAPISIMDALERGWAADMAEQQFLEERIRLGEDGTWMTHPLTSSVRVMGRVFYDTARSMTVDPLILGGQAVLEGAWTGRDILRNVFDHEQQLQTRRDQQEQREEYWERSSALGLGAIRVERPDGRTTLVDSFPPGSPVTLAIDPIAGWDIWSAAQWEWQEAGRPAETILHTISHETAQRVSWSIPQEAQGPLTIRLRIFDELEGKQIGYREAVLTLDQKPALGTLSSYLGYVGGPDPGGPVDHGITVAYSVTPVGRWLPQHTVEWSVAGEVWKRGSATDESMTRWTLDTGLLDIRPHQVFVELFDERGQRLDLRQMPLTFVMQEQAESKGEAEISRQEDELYEPISIGQAFVSAASDPWTPMASVTAEDSPQVTATLGGSDGSWPAKFHVEIWDAHWNFLDSAEFVVEAPGTYLFPLPTAALAGHWNAESVDFHVSLTAEDAHQSMDSDVVAASWITGYAVFDAPETEQPPSVHLPPSEPQNEPRLLGPDYIEPDEWYVFELDIPVQWQRPLRLSLEMSAGLDVDWSPGDEFLLVRGEPSDWPNHAWLSVTVEDAAGRQAFPYAEVDVLAAMPGWDQPLQAEPDITGPRAVTKADLFASIRAGDEQEVDLLIRSGVDIDSVEDQTNAPFTPLMVAAQYCYPAIVNQLLAAGADAAYVNNWGQNALHLAVQSKQEVVDRLASEMQASRDDGHRYHDYIVSAMVPTLTQAGADPNAVANLEGPPLMRAIQNHMVDSVYALVAAGARSDHGSDSGRTPRAEAQARLDAFRLSVEGAERRGETNTDKYRDDLQAVSDMERILTAF